jgi:hypothetical protein
MLRWRDHPIREDPTTVDWLDPIYDGTIERVYKQGSVHCNEY